jgi:uncharacterized membrane protein
MIDSAILTLTYFCLFAQRTAPKKSGGAFDMNTVIMLILSAGVVAILSVIAYYIGLHLRKGALEDEKSPTTADHLKTFREAADEGSMSAQEFAVVKKHLSQKIMAEVKQENPRTEPDDDLPKFIPQ